MKRFPYISDGIPNCGDLRQRLGAGNGADQRRVKDQSGAVLPGVEVTATQTETGARIGPYE